jgi:protease-4
MSEMTERQPDRDTDQAASWQQDVLEKLLLATLTEQRRARRWGIFFKLAFLAYLAVALWLFAKPFDLAGHDERKGHTSVVDVSGQIVEGSETNADTIINGLRAAAKDTGTKGIVLRMNSPGGSPVQSAYVYDEIRRLMKEKPGLKIYAMVSDLCASGCYYIASAAERIFVNRASMVGSIGVIMGGFGFVESLNKLGVERRLLRAGEHKALLDPFSPVDEAEKQHVQSVLDGVHRQFIDAVKRGRGGRLKDDPALFSGLVWTGDEAIKLGLVDEIGDLHKIAKDVIGAEEIVNFTARERLLERLSRRIGTSLGQSMQGALGWVGTLR